MKLSTRQVSYVVLGSVLLGLLLGSGIESIPSPFSRAGIGALVGLTFAGVAVVQSFDQLTRVVLAGAGAVSLFFAFVLLALGSTNGSLEMVAIGTAASMLCFLGVRRL
jgi:hypothetical protein